MNTSERLYERCQRLGLWIKRLNTRNGHLRDLLNTLRVSSILVNKELKLLAYTGAAKQLLSLNAKSVGLALEALPAFQHADDLLVALLRPPSEETIPRHHWKAPAGPTYQVNWQVINSDGDLRIVWQPRTLISNRKDLLQQIIDLMPHEIYAKDTHGHFLLVNKAMAKANGTTVQELAGQHISSILTDPLQIRRALDEDQKVIKAQERLYQESKRITDKSGADRYIRTTKWPIFCEDTGEGAVLGLSVDITEQQQTQSALKRRNFYDSLTDLPNRNLFMDRLSHALETSRRQDACTFALLLLDLDSFKDINDSQGYGAGNDLLIEMARRLEGCLRPGDTVARLGGDEFAILLNPLVSAEGALRVCKRIHQAVSQVYRLDQTRFFLSTSIGLAMPDGRPITAENLMRNADVAMYHAKRLGPGRTQRFYPQLQEAAQERTQMKRELRDALHHNQFRLNYQPIVCLRTGELAGMEALIRWAHPNRGIVSPADFLPVAESSGAMPALEAWVVVEACRQMRRWQDEMQLKVPPRVSLNISPDRLADEHFVDHIQAILKEYDLDPMGLTVELTESSLIENPVATRNTLSRLRSMRIKVALDDFGTGFSSLSHLHHFPMDALKVDKSFTQHLHKADSRSHIVRATVSLGQSLGLSVTAEGIENKEQLSFLRKLGCNLGQGYYFSRPLPPTQFEGLLKQHHRWPL